MKKLFTFVILVFISSAVTLAGGEQIKSFEL
jgi:hypothetical protein